jgi:hypothetical protein
MCLRICSVNGQVSHHKSGDNLMTCIPGRWLSLNLAHQVILDLWSMPSHPKLDTTKTSNLLLPLQFILT